MDVIDTAPEAEGAGRGTGRRRSRPWRSHRSGLLAYLVNRAACPSQLHGLTCQRRRESFRNRLIGAPVIGDQRSSRLGGGRAAEVAASGK